MFRIISRTRKSATRSLTNQDDHREGPTRSSSVVCDTSSFLAVKVTGPKSRTQGLSILAEEFGLLSGWTMALNPRNGWNDGGMMVKLEKASVILLVESESSVNAWHRKATLKACR